MKEITAKTIEALLKKEDGIEQAFEKPIETLRAACEPTLVKHDEGKVKRTFRGLVSAERIEHKYNGDAIKRAHRKLMDFRDSFFKACLRVEPKQWDKIFNQLERIYEEPYDPELIGYFVSDLPNDIRSICEDRDVSASTRGNFVVKYLESIVESNIYLFDEKNALKILEDTFQTLGKTLGKESEGRQYLRKAVKVASSTNTGFGRIFKKEVLPKIVGFAPVAEALNRKGESPSSLREATIKVAAKGLEPGRVGARR